MLPHLFLVLAASCPDAPENIVRTAAGAGQFRTLLTALAATGLDDALKGEGPFTVFAPSDKAFDKLPAGTLARLLQKANRPLLARILKFHVVPGRLLAADLAKVKGVKTLAGEAEVAHGRHGLTVAGVRVVAADIAAGNGVIHVVESVLMPPMPARPSARAAIEKLGTFKTLLAALDAAGLADVLETEATVLAPTDAAFAKLPAGTVSTLLRPENKEKLAAILRYHVIAGAVPLRDAVAAREVATAAGPVVSFGVADSGRATVNGAEVIAGNVKAGKLTVHVVGTVLMPK